MKDTQWLCVAEYCHTTLPRIPASQLLGGLLKGPPTRPSQTHSAGPSHPKQLCLWSHVPPISISASGGHQQLRAAPSQHTQGGCPCKAGWCVWEEEGVIIIFVFFTLLWKYIVFSDNPVQLHHNKTHNKNVIHFS